MSDNTGLEEVKLSAINVTQEADVLILQDLSSLMGKGRLQLASCNYLVQRLADSLPTTDRLGYITFDSEAIPAFQLTSIDELREHRTLESLLRGIRAHGKTALYDAIFSAAGQVLDKGRPTWLVVLSRSADDNSLFSVPFMETLLGRFPNLHLCFIQLGEDRPIHKRLAELTNGSYHLIDDTELVPTEADQQHATLQAEPMTLLASAMQTVLSDIHSNLTLNVPDSKRIYN